MEKDFEGWNNKKQSLDKRNFSGFVVERGIYWCSIGVNIGNEENGKNENYERPILVLKKFNSNFIFGIPLTTKPKRNFYHYAFMYDNLNQSALLSQIRTFSTQRFRRFMGYMPRKHFSNIQKRIIRKLLKAIPAF